MIHGMLLLVLGLAIAQPPTPAPSRDATELPELKSGTLVLITTGRDSITGTIEDGGTTDFLRLKVDGVTTPTFVRRSAIETIRILPIPQMPRAAEAVAAVNPNKHLVYVHGICRHTAGFSKPWWDAMKPFTPQIMEANIHEVVWSDIVNPEMARAATPSAVVQPRQLNDEQKRLAETLQAILRDRAEQAEPESGGTPPGPVSAADEHADEMAARAGLFGGITGAVECANDFVLYMTVTSIREQVLDRFDRVVQPLLERGAEVEIISHSWGTVVAYEGLRRLESQSSGSLQGTVHNLFTVGSALSIGPVKVNLAGRFPGGSKPRRVVRWVNLDAQFDIVGGHIQSAPFVVDVERLHLAPVGCSFPVTPTCSHSSYFDARNTPVNRDIFGRYIGM
jgi:hypothetical protein